MIKLRTLLKEIRSDYPDPSLKDYLLSNKIEILSAWLYHGSPYDGLYSILTTGISGVEHGEIAEQDTISTSINSEVLHLFSEGDGETGLQFNVKNAKVLVMDSFIHKLMIELPGSGMDVDVDEKQFEEFCLKFKVPKDRDYYLPYGYLSSLGIDAFIFDYVWKRMHTKDILVETEMKVKFVS
jgi:hypothetical protein